MEDKYEKRLNRIRRKNQKRSLRKKTGRLIRNVSLVMVGIFAGFLVFFLFRETALEKKSRDQLKKLQETVASPMGSVEENKEALSTEAGEEEIPEVRTGENSSRLSHYQMLYQENNDFCGWLRIPDTRIDYPVMYREGDNDYYLSHDFYGQEDKNGLLVLDKRCDPTGPMDHLLIHGHNMKSGLMFGELKEYKEEAYYKKHPLIWYDTLYHEYTYTVAAVFLSTVRAEDTGHFDFYDYIRIGSEEEFNAYVEGAKAAALYETGKTPVYGDCLLTLSTCDYTNEDGRLVLLAYRKQE